MVSFEGTDLSREEWFVSESYRKVTLSTTWKDE